MRLHAEAREFRAMEHGRAVIADLPNVARAHAPLLTCHHGAGDLAARENVYGMAFDFGAGRGKLPQRNKRVGGVESHTDNVNVRSVSH